MKRRLNIKTRYSYVVINTWCDVKLNEDEFYKNKRRANVVRTLDEHMVDDDLANDNRPSDMKKVPSLTLSEELKLFISCSYSYFIMYRVCKTRQYENSHKKCSGFYSLCKLLVHFV